MKFKFSRRKLQKFRSKILRIKSLISFAVVRRVCG